MDNHSCGTREVRTPPLPRSSRSPLRESRRRSRTTTRDSGRRSQILQVNVKRRTRQRSRSPRPSQRRSRSPVRDSSRPRRSVGRSRSSTRCSQRRSRSLERDHSRRRLRRRSRSLERDSSQRRSRTMERDRNRRSQSQRRRSLYRCGPSHQHSASSAVGELQEQRSTSRQDDHCEAVSIWTLNRHGNRNPGGSVTLGMREIVGLKEEIIASYEAGDSKLCSQDIENFRKWHWNKTMEVTHSYLTGTGYEELYAIGKRIREKYPDLLTGGSTEEFYFRPTNEQRTITSCKAFIHGLTNGLNLNVTVGTPSDRDDVIRPYGHCDRYQQEVKVARKLTDHLDAYFQSPEYIAVMKAVQERLGIKTQLDASNVFSVYEMCRFYRSWTDTLQSPWCAAFSDQDLKVLEYHDDVRHYYRNGYGSWVNVNLGKSPLKDLYDSFELAVNGQGKKVVSYFTHDTMMEMTLSALGLYKEDGPLKSNTRSIQRVWRTSFIGAFSSNLIAVLNSCSDGDSTYRVQLFLNEKETDFCPIEGCSWQEFQERFQEYSNANLDFCSMRYDRVHTGTDKPVSDSGSNNRILSWSRKRNRY